MMNNQSCACGSGSCGSCHSTNWHNGKAWALLALRIAAGVIFIYHGYGKLFGTMPGMVGFTGMVEHLGFPVPSFFAYVVAILEFFGGIALVLGIYVRKIGILFAIEMLVTFSLVRHFQLGMGDIDLMLLATAIALALTGGGKFSVLRPKKTCCMPDKMEAAPMEAKK